MRLSSGSKKEYRLYTVDHSRYRRRMIVLYILCLVFGFRQLATLVEEKKVYQRYYVFEYAN